MQQTHTYTFETDENSTAAKKYRKHVLAAHGFNEKDFPKWPQGETRNYSGGYYYGHGGTGRASTTGPSSASASASGFSQDLSIQMIPLVFLRDRMVRLLVPGFSPTGRALGEGILLLVVPPPLPVASPRHQTRVRASEEMPRHQEKGQK